ncbi:MAG: hypothetical protein L6Q57_08165 [Alphaproteobacteria bacterium]|nr:hypothetical protein [Alphaproteobacteria bacterium]
MSDIDVNEPIETFVVDSDAAVRRRGRVFSSGARLRTAVRGVSLTKQADADRANIHKLLDRFKRSGHLPQRVAQPLEGKLPSVESFHEAMNVVAYAQQSFEAMPVAIRQKFDNSPSKMLAFISDEKNRDEMARLGLLKASTEVKIPGATPVAPPEAQRAQNAGVAEGGAGGEAP